MALEIGKTYYIKNVATGKYLNVYGNDTISDGRNVTLYSKSNTNSQKWVVRIYGGGAHVLSMINQSYGLNIFTADSNCTMWPTAGNDSDCIVDFLTINASQNLYRIKMIAHNKFLRATGSADLANVNWSTTSDTYAQWVLEAADGITPPPITGNKLTYPCKTMNISQRHDGSYSHLPCSTGTPADYPIDEICTGSPERSYMYCPCDEMEVVRIYGVGGNGVNTIWLRSTSPVSTPSGTFNVVLMVTHPNDDDLSGIRLNKKFTRGQAMFREGGDGPTGNSHYANHFHISVGKGNFVTPAGLVENSKNAWVIKTTEGPLLPTQAFYLDRSFTQVILSNGYNFTET